MRAKRAVVTATAPDLDPALAVERDFWKERAHHLQRRLDGAVERSPSSRVNTLQKSAGSSLPKAKRRSYELGLPSLRP